jgi:hypothetical protein
MRNSKHRVLVVLPLFLFASMSLQACSSSSAHPRCDSLTVLADQFNADMANGNYEMAFATVRSIYFEIKDEPEVPADDTIAGRIENTKGMANLIVNGGADTFGVANVMSTIQTNMLQIKSMCS